MAEPENQTRGGDNQSDQNRRNGPSLDEKEREGLGDQANNNISMAIDEKLASLEQSINQVTASKTLTMSAIVTVGIIVILFSTLVIYLGVYGYANPDPEHCYYVDGVD